MDLGPGVVEPMIDVFPTIEDWLRLHKGKVRILAMGVRRYKDVHGFNTISTDIYHVDVIPANGSCIYEFLVERLDGGYRILWALERCIVLEGEGRRGYRSGKAVKLCSKATT
jgi:hypothetical protein